MPDFAQFGPIEIKPLGRVQRISGSRLHASWVNLPHVTQFDEADVTELEETRQALKAKADSAGIKLTTLAFIVRACVKALQQFPLFNTSLDASGENLVYKKYIHIGFAADTPNGLLVPVIRDADRKDIYEIARALAELSGKARSGKLAGADMQGGSFTISSLGGIGGTAFTPIINAPEVAILGVSRSAIKPVFRDGAFVPRMMLPLSLSYDHRVIDGANGARFTSYLVERTGRRARPDRGGAVSRAEILCPDLGDFKDVPVIDVMVKPGDSIELETPLITLETDKATMDVPSTAAGQVLEVLVSKGSKVSKGTPLLLVETGAAAATSTPAAPSAAGRSGVTADRPRRRARRPARAGRCAEGGCNGHCGCAIATARSQRLSPRPRAARSCWCSAPVPAVTPRPFAPRISGSRSR